MVAGAILLMLGCGGDSLTLDPLLLRKHESLIRRIDALEKGGGDPGALQADIAALAPEIEVVDPRQAAVLWSRFARRVAGGDPRAAASAHALSADVRRRSGDRAGLALALHEQGMSLRALGESAGALRCVMESAQVFSEDGGRGCEAAARLRAGRLQEDLGLWQDAAREYKRALRIFIDLGGHRVRTAETLNRLGLVLVESGQDAEGARCFEAAGKVCAELGAPELAARLSMERARAHERKERLDEALEDLERAADHFRDARDERTAARLGMRRGTVLLRRGRPEDAVPLLDAAIAAFEKPEDEGALTDAYVARARALTALGRAEQATRDWTEALQRARGREGPLRMAQLLVSKAADMAALGSLEDALRDATEGLEAFEKLGLKPQIAGAARARSALLTRLGRTGEALADLVKAEEIYSRLGSSAARDRIVLRRAALLSSLGRDEDALAEYERLIPQLQGGGRPELLKCAMTESGLALSSLGRPEAALARLEAASQVCRTDSTEGERALLAVHKGKALVDLGRSAEALRELDGASGRLRAPGDKPALANALLQRGRALRGVGRTEEALAALADAERLATAAGDLGVAAGACSEKGSAYLERGDVGEGIRELERGAETVEKALRAGAPADRSCARLQAEGRPILSRMMRALREARDPSRELVASAFRVAQVFHGLGLAEIVAPPRAARADEVQAALPEGTGLVEVIDDAEWVTAFVLTRGGLDAVQVGRSEDVARDVEQALATLETAESLRGLGRRVLDPILALLPAGGAIRTLYFSPHGSLARVPLEALLTVDPERGASPRDWPYLAKTFAVAHVHSGSALREALIASREARAGGRRTIVAFGHPRRAEAAAPSPSLAAVLDPRPSGSVTLPGAALEVLRIARLFAGEEHLLEILRLESRLGRDPTAALGELAGESFMLFLGAAATEDALKTRSAVKDARVLHVACPGRADLDAPSLSHLALAVAGADAEDGIVTATELARLKIGAELVVLSACEVGSGRRRPFEGLAGLPRAAQAAGAQSVLSTLWQVDDDAARAILEGFYRMWLEGSAAKLGALATAKRMAIREGVPVRIWSAYILWDAGQ
jgi:CHAT domain-containing protein